MHLSVRNELLAEACRFDPRLPAITNRFTRSLLDHHTTLIKELVDGIGSPLHFVFPQIFAENISELKGAADKSGIDTMILFAKKANKAACFAERCMDAAVGMDVASLGELEKALAAGVPGTLIGVSGPPKSRKLLSIASSHGCMIAIDSLGELNHAIVVARECGRQLHIVLRCQTDNQSSSRFGLSFPEIDVAFTTCLSEPDRVRLLGLSFHLSGYCIGERARAASALIDLCDRARAMGLKECRSVDIGGGLPIRYVEPEDWEAFQCLDSPRNYHASKTFGGFYPYGGARAKAQALADILGFCLDGAITLGEKFRRREMKLVVEPGRALLDQAGMTAFRVQGVKDRTATSGYAIVTVEGSSFNLSEQWFNSEYLPDPILISSHPRPRREFAACIGGATCLESDMLTWRKIRFDREIGVGDLIVYLNTAGYQMDSNESPFHEAKLPHKVVLEFEHERIRWRLDGLA
nr:alanine racemase [Methylosinus sp. RM1]